MSILHVRELSVRAEGATLRGVELWAAAGEVVLVLGDEGASLLLRTVAGVLNPAAGAVRVDGDDLTGRAAADAAARGVVLVPAAWAAYGGLTVRENVLVGAYGDPATAQAALAASALPPDRPADALDPVEERVLAVTVALARRPRVLLVDGLGAATGPALAAARAAGVTAVVAERTEFAGRVPEVPDGIDVGAYDRTYVVRNGLVRPWHAVAAGEADDS